MCPPFCLQAAGWSALHFAALNGNHATAKRLLEGGADVTLQDNDGETALDLARMEGKGELVALLSEPRYADGERTECESNANRMRYRLRYRLRTEMKTEMR